MSDEKTAKYRLTGRYHRKDGKIYEKGAILDLTEREVRGLVNKIELVVEEKPEFDPETDTPSKKGEYQASLDHLGVEYDAGANKDELVALYEEAMLG